MDRKLTHWFKVIAENIEKYTIEKKEWRDFRISESHNRNENIAFFSTWLRLKNFKGYLSLII